MIVIAAHTRGEHDQRREHERPGRKRGDGRLVYVATGPPMPLLGREAGTQVFRDLGENPGDETFSGIAVVRLDGGLFFATAEALEDRVRELTVDGRQCRALVLDLEGVDFVDSQGAAKLSAQLADGETSGPPAGGDAAGGAS